MPLAPYAMLDAETEGRRFPESRHSYRSEYQRDRDRVIHTKAFRRLENKTQVFAPDYSDHFRNRLTHTLEVSQISRTISQALGLNTDLCEVLALSHDIGHPPFSHEGEKALDAIMKKFGRGFDHNLHALRIVEDFEEKYASFRGLNLTFEVREGIIKHSRDYPSAEESYVDISAYRLQERPPLEGQLIDLADEIAYNTADLDDGYSSGLLSVEHMAENLTLFRVTLERVQRLHPSAPEKLCVGEVIRRLIDYLVTDLIQHTKMVLTDLSIESVAQVRVHPRRLVGFSPEGARLNAEIKQFLRGELYDHDILLQARMDVRRKLSDLFDYYYSDSQRLAEKYRVRCPDLGSAGVVCDYIAGMTDSYARRKHRELFGEAGEAHPPARET